MKHVVSLSMTKTADGLIDPKLILSWILTTLSAPAFFIGLLVPVREAGALLPQLFTSGFLQSLPVRKWAWAAGSLLQGLCAISIGVASIYLEGSRLGITVVSLLGILALARSICSVSYKDVLGKTVDQSKRGTATGTASSIAAGSVIIYAIIMASGFFDKISLTTAGLFIAGGFWIFATAIFSTLTEESSSAAVNKNPMATAYSNCKYLLEDRQLRYFIMTRGLLIATALAPPFMVALSAQAKSNHYGELGFLLLASSGAALCSSYIWGRLSDSSSRKVLLYSGLTAALTLSITSVLAFYEITKLPWVLPVLLFGLMVSYQGVRLGRSTHLVDMTDEDKRAAYTALSNTIIGILLLLGSGFSLIAHYYGEIAVLILLACMATVSVFTAYNLKEVQK